MFREKVCLDYAFLCCYYHFPSQPEGKPTGTVACDEAAGPPVGISGSFPPRMRR